MSRLQTIPARRGKAFVWQRASRSKSSTRTAIRSSTSGVQCRDLREYMGMEHCRAFWTRLFPVAGDKMVTNRRRPILTLTEDHSPAATTR